MVMWIYNFPFADIRVNPDEPISYRKPRKISNEQKEQARQKMIERNKGKTIKVF